MVVGGCSYKMTKNWFLRGTLKGIKTEKFPAAGPLNPPLWPSRLNGSGDVQCPTDAIKDGIWDEQRCIFCRRCLPNYEPTEEQDIFTVRENTNEFRKSLNIYFVDTGSCGSCNAELSTIFSPRYDANRLSIFAVNTPRHADVLVVMGILTEMMKEPLYKALEAMPEPKAIVLLGTCSITGGIMGKGVLLPEDANLILAGCPPSPYTILEGLERLKGGKK